MAGAMRHLLVMALAAGIGFGKPAAGAALDELAAGQKLSAEHVGFILVDVASGKVLAEHQGDRLVVPASVAKLPTAIAAISSLGTEHRFATELSLAGSTLILVGGGDPLLVPEDLRPGLRRLRDSGARIDRFIYDVTAWPESSEIDPLQPEASSYNPGVGALALDFNRVMLEWKGGGRERSAIAISDALRLEADAVSVLLSSVPTPYRLRADGPDRWLLANPTEAGRTWLPVKQPGLNAAMVVRRLAEREGVRLPIPVAGRRPAEAQPLHLHPSLPLAEIVKRVLEHSNNMAAEMVGLATAMQVGESRPSSLATSVSVVDGWLSAQFPEIDWTGNRRANHSGLSPESRTTPRQMAGLVRHAALRIPDLIEFLPKRELTDSDPDESRNEARPKAKPRAKALASDNSEGKAKAKDDGGKRKAETKAGNGDDGPKVALRYRAKTGTMAYARGLVGLMTPNSGRQLAFAIFVYDDARRAQFDATLDRNDPVMPPEAIAWLRRARNVERGILRAWTIAY
ncbi:MAG: D-alanyl-D-alanine carboxypeptidase [Alphaproteobacteria bacterium]|nr:D-alanyl-D-alanine carboxypeptidase [Alphaproteobacteria bacterium]